MIQPLRIAHRCAFIALAIVLPVVMLAGLAGRHQRQIGRGTTSRLPESARLLRKAPALWQRHAAQSEFYGDVSRTDSVFVVLSPAQEWNEPDLILYWSADAPAGDSLPERAQLLGAFRANRPSALPMDAARDGYLVLYSLPHQAVFDYARVEKLP